MLEKPNFILSFTLKVLYCLGWLINFHNLKVLIEGNWVVKVQAKRDKGDVFDITYSKKVESLVVLSDENINWSLNDNTLLRFYKKNLEKDSSLVVVRANDRVGYEITDSVYVSFSGNQKRDFELDLDIDWSSQNIDDTVLFTMSFNLPLIKTEFKVDVLICLLYTSPSPRDQRGSRMPSSA